MTDPVFMTGHRVFFCEVTDESVPIRPDEHEVLDGAEPVWVESLATPIHRNRQAYERFGEPFIHREMRVMEMADEALRKRSGK